MKIVFGYQDVLEVINNGVSHIESDATIAQKVPYREEKMKDYKDLYLIDQCVYADNFEKVEDCESSKKAWEILEKSYVGAKKAKVVRLQTHRRQL